MKKVFFGTNTLYKISWNTECNMILLKYQGFYDNTSNTNSLPQIPNPLLQRNQQNNIHMNC